MAADLGLESIYAGWQVTARTNGGDAEISGIELNYNQPLNFIPVVGRYFSFSAMARASILSTSARAISRASSPRPATSASRSTSGRSTSK